ncbi:unnamed protein product [Didymodactylos carnosus]|uniref:Peptidase M60 domain-containing protein n=1 Tax=Didymodactylos carnosus TaxID=1234261 RepID=A0A814JX99_9BILA|nr:unnamed protein product [Didymodactylos carnosus]CAF1269770.1 unnamed protein product [Didymodactylos carnosus]CAF3813381.1 unnamed protein product [Didymodactylos carnosus]CAF4075464.1 unnamed protein product [Didymodactylos carnosus]
MDDDEFDKVSSVIFNNVKSIPKVGLPGVIIPQTADTRALLCGQGSQNCLMIATRFRKGRAIICAHNGYVYKFKPPIENDYSTFVKNCKEWLVPDCTVADDQVVSIDDVSSMESVSEKAKILLWNGHYDKSEEFMNALCQYLQDGGGLVCAVTPWGWLQRYPGKHLPDFPFSRFCDYVGVRLTDEYNHCSDPILVRPELVKFKNIDYVVKELKDEQNNTEYMTIVGHAIRELEDTYPGFPLETLQNIVLNAGKDVIPETSCPITDKKCRELSSGICGIMCALPGIKAPNIMMFPGDFKETPYIYPDASWQIESHTSEWHCTGFYVVAGVPIEIEVLDGKPGGWQVRIGCHSDDLRNCAELRRWSCISVCKPLTNKVRMYSAYGGLLFLQSSEGNNNISIQIHHVVQAPVYDLNDPDRKQKWKHQRQTDGLWADIAGRHIVFNLPSASVVHIDDFDPVLEFWDRIILAHHELRGTKPTRRERVVCDEQPSAGYMHSGYPIVTHLDVCRPDSTYFILNLEHLEKDGAWGLFHELGHNMQQKWWTFDGTGEVTVNIFTLHAMDAVCNLKTWIHPWLKDQLSKTTQYLKDGSNFDQWKQSPGVALFIYAQLAREFGWDAYKQVFRIYEKAPPTLNNDQEKIDHWIVTFSQTVDCNLCPLFKFWGFPISSSTKDSLSSLPVRNINDELIEIAPNRYAM